jgi:hypothetical protein
VTGKNLSFLRKRPQLFANSREKEIVISMRKIGPPDATLEKDVASDENGDATERKADRVRRVPRDMENFEIQVAEREFRFPLKKVIDAVGIQCAGDPHHLLEAPGHGEFFGWLRVGPDRTVKFGKKRTGADHVIVMLMCQDQSIDTLSVFREPVGNAVRSIEEPGCSAD